MPSRWIALSLLLVAVTACDDGMVDTVVPQGPQTPAVVRFVPSASAYVVGNTIPVTVQIENATNVGAAAFHVRYDTQRLVFVAPALEGEFLGRLGGSTSFLADDSVSGEIALDLERISAGQGVSGAGVLATVSFRAIGSGRVAFTATAAGVRDATGANLPASFVGTSVSIAP